MPHLNTPARKRKAWKRKQERLLQSVTTYVYLIENITTEHLKIGFSKNVYKRLATLQTASPHKLKLLAVKKGNLAKEKELHLEFAHLKVIGEWFIPNEAIISRFVY